MTRNTADKRAAFRALHEQGCFVIPNPWDVGSARMLQHVGFAALASTSAGYAWTTGRADNNVTRDDVLQHLASLCAAVDLPVNADFESGFAADPEALAANVGLCIDDRRGGLVDRGPRARSAIRSLRHDILGGANPRRACSHRPVRARHRVGRAHRGTPQRSHRAHTGNRQACRFRRSWRRLSVRARRAREGRHRRRWFARSRRNH